LVGWIDGVELVHKVVMFIFPLRLLLLLVRLLQSLEIGIIRRIGRLEVGKEKEDNELAPSMMSVHDVVSVYVVHRLHFLEIRSSFLPNFPNPPFAPSSSLVLVFLLCFSFFSVSGPVGWVCDRSSAGVGGCGTASVGRNVVSRQVRGSQRFFAAAVFNRKVGWLVPLEGE